MPTKRRRTRFSSDLQARWPLLALSAIVLVGIVVRVVDLTSNPRGFFADEASFGVNAHLVLTTGRDERGALFPLFFRAFGEYKLPLFIYAELPFVALFGRTELAVRLTAAALGALTIVTTYLLARELFGRQLPALASAAFLAILPWHIHYSRIGFEVIALPLFVTAGLYLFLRAIRLNSSMVPAAVVFAVAFYTYRAAWIFLPPLMLVLGITHRKELLKNRRDTLFSAGVLLVMLLPIVRHLVSASGDRAFQSWILNVESERSTLSLFWQQYRSYFSLDFLFRLGDNGYILRHYLPGHGVLYWVLLPLILAGLIRTVVVRDRGSVLLIVMLVLYPLSGALSDSSPISSRTILGSVTFALLSGAGVVAMADAIFWSSLPRPALCTAALLVMVGLATVSAFSSYLRHYFEEYPALSAGYWGWQDGPQEIIATFLVLQHDYDELYLPQADGNLNAPGIFFRFYAGDRCIKCHLGGFDKYDAAKRQLFALRADDPDLARYNHRTRGVLQYPDGSPSFFLVEFVPYSGAGTTAVGGIGVSS